MLHHRCDAVFFNFNNAFSFSLNDEAHSFTCLVFLSLSFFLISLQLFFIIFQLFSKFSSSFRTPRHGFHSTKVCHALQSGQVIKITQAYSRNVNCTCLKICQCPVILTVTMKRKRTKSTHKTVYCPETIFSHVEKHFQTSVSVGIDVFVIVRGQRIFSRLNPARWVKPRENCHLQQARKMLQLVHHSTLTHRCVSLTKLKILQY